MNWKLRVSCGRASLRFSVFWTAFWVVWLVLSVTSTMPGANDYTTGFSAAMLITSFFSTLGVLGSLLNKYPSE